MIDIIIGTQEPKGAFYFDAMCQKQFDFKLNSITYI